MWEVQTLAGAIVSSEVTMRWFAVVLAFYFFYLGLARAQEEGRVAAPVIIEEEFHQAVRECEALKTSMSIYYSCLVENIEKHGITEERVNKVRLAAKLHQIVRSIDIKWRLTNLFAWEADYVVREGVSGNHQSFVNRDDAERYRDARALQLLERRTESSGSASSGR